MPSEDYLLQNRQPQAGERLTALSTLFDAWTLRHFDEIGVASGWHCWEVGAGGASVPGWLADRVGRTGRVLATDLDVSWLPPRAAYEVQVHDVSTEPPPGQRFDLVHARLVLVHVSNRALALRSMVSALRPGGWLVLEDADPALQPLACPDEIGPEQELANRLRRGFRQLMAARGADLAYGRSLPRLLRAAGLADVRADAYFPMTNPACAELEAATIRQIRGQLLTAGFATDAEIDRHLASVASGTMDLATAVLISAWGRKR